MLMCRGLTLILVANALALLSVSCKDKSQEAAQQTEHESLPILARSPAHRDFGPTLLRIWDLSMEHCGFVDLKGKIVIEPQWEDATDFREGYAAVQQKGKWGWVDKAGLHIDQQLSKPVEFHGGLALFERDGKTGFVDPTGKVVIEPQWELAWDFNEG